MKFTLAPEIYTDKFDESVQFYTEVLGFVHKTAPGGFQAMEGFAVLVHPANPACELYVCVPNSPFVDELFRPAFKGSEGLIFQVEVDNVDELYAKAQALGTPIVLKMIKDPGNGKHFAVRDPNGIIIDIVEF
jgi:catechol 2,3-dioxygenase-like lactoylglutathione lyase family enzyme